MSTLRYVTYGLGIIVFFVIRELLVDQLYSKEYGPEKEKFRLSGFLVFVQSLVNCIWAIVIPLLQRYLFTSKVEVIKEEPEKSEKSKKSEKPVKGGPKGKSLSSDAIQRRASDVVIETEEPEKHHWFRILLDFSIPALAQCVAGYCGNKCMEYVDGTTKTVVKSVKPLPIMVVGYFFGKKYHLYRWLAVSAVIVGVTMFLLGFETKGKDKKYDETMIEIGIMWSLVALVMDGFVGSTQDNVRKKYKPSASALMLSSNLCALIISLFTDLLYSGEFTKAIEFQQKYPEVIWELMIASIANPFGNHFIFLMVSEFGALQCALVTTVRKFLTILVNSMWLGRWFTPFQILAVVGVFMGLLADSYVSDQEKKKELAAKQALKDEQKKKQ